MKLIHNLLDWVVNFSIVYTAQSKILNSELITVETDISNGLYSFNIVGLANKTVSESKDRISSALKNSGFKEPKNQNKKIIVSLAPANIPKHSSNFDLAITLGYLKSKKEIDFDSENKIFVGELSLDGKIKKIKNIIPIIIFAKKNNYTEIFIPSENYNEAMLIDGIKIFHFKNLAELVQFLKNQAGRQGIKNNITNHNYSKYLVKTINTDKIIDQINYGGSDYINIIGQNNAKRALEISAAGGHNLGLWGPPGTGKTILAKSIIDLMPNLNQEQIIETTAIYSSIQDIKAPITRPPFRHPHHSSSLSAIIGGGALLKPGEITLSHNGVLFLDEFPEFNQKVINSLREPLEEKEITLSRINSKETLPANFILLAALNPCACGYYKTGIKKCSCTMNQINKYHKKISGPILDRVDLWVEMNNVKYDILKINQPGTSKQFLKKLEITKNKILSARKVQEERLGLNKLNSQMSNAEIKKHCAISEKAANILNRSSEKLCLSPRSYYKIIKISRTIADLENSNKILMKHVLEALQYRPKF